MILNTRIKHKRDSEENWTTTNPTLLNGEVVLIDTSDGSLKLKVGDGSTTYTSLSHFDFIPGATSTDNDKVLSIVDGKPAWVAQSSYKIESITQENYDALTTKDDNTLYIIEV